MSNDIINKVNQYYSQKIVDNGATSKGVDWNSLESHYLRFDQLTGLLPKEEEFSVLDFGCGYGALIDYLLDKKFKNYKYFGYDISKEMIQAAEAKYKNQNLSFNTEISNFETNKFDYTIANGIFNVRLDVSENEWKEYIVKTLNQINEISTKGFSFNILTSYSDLEFMKDYLYYADPLYFFDYCKRNFSKQVALLHDYPLYEFSILVKKQ